jgi:hypothetical protein
MFGANELAWTTWAQTHSQYSMEMTAHQQDRDHFSISSCPTFFLAPSIALLRLVARLERQDF